MSDPYLYEFLYRGQPDGSGAYHVIVAADDVDAFGDPTHAEKIYSMTDAATAGYDLPATISGINASTLKDLETRTTERDGLQTQLADVQSELTSAQQQIVALQAQIAAMQQPPAAAPAEAPAA